MCTEEMNKIKTLIKVSLSSFLIISFAILLLWSINFEFVLIDDFRLIVILLASSSILIMLGVTDFENIYDISIKLRFSIFAVSILMTIMQVFNILNQQKLVEANHLIASVKPIIYALIFYTPVSILLKRYQEQNVNEGCNVEVVDLLTRREGEVLQCVLVGLTNKEIGEKLFIQESTVKKHVQHILKKMSCNDRVELINKVNKIEKNNN